MRVFQDAALERFWSDRLRAWPSALIAGAAALLLYVATLGSHVYTADVAEFQTLARSGGISHAGYPAYVLLQQAFAKIPLGTLPWRANLLSTLFGAATVALLAYVGHRWTGRAAPAIVAALAFAASVTMWNESTLAGVHAPTLAVGAALLVLALRYLWEPSLGVAVVAALSFGLGLTGHLTVLGLGLPLLLAFAFGVPRVARPVLHVATVLVAFAVGLTPFAYTLAVDRPEQPMNYLHDTLEPGEYSFAVERPDLGQRVARLGWLVSGRQYLGRNHLDARVLWHRAQHVVSVLVLDDLPFGSSLLAVAGLALLLLAPGWPRALVAAWFASSSVLAGIGGTERTLHYFILPCTWVLALGLAEALAWLGKRQYALAVAAMCFVLAMPLLRQRVASPPAFLQRSAMWVGVWNMSPTEWNPFHENLRYDAYGRGVMQRLPEHAVVLGGQWEDCETLRYFVHGETLRPDVSVLYAGTRDPRLTRLWHEAVAAGRPVFATRPPEPGALPGARAELVWDSGWQRLWQLEGVAP